MFLQENKIKNLTDKYANAQNTAEKHTIQAIEQVT